ncbi:hypothetical protein [Mycolicibacterium vanbaalenii]|nr:hypothetical protein [Mycolicibacterium vanbaalenii]
MSPATTPAGELQAFPAIPAPRTRATRYTMLVLAVDEADAVGAAGGLLFDRANIGWVIDVRTALRAGETPFRILGVPVGALAEPLQAPEQWPDTLVVSGELHARDTAVRKLFSEAAGRPDTEVAMWGGAWPRDTERGDVCVEHRLSCAAIAFKSHAMVAAGLPSHVGVTEQFRSGRGRLGIAAAVNAAD